VNKSLFPTVKICFIRRDILAQKRNNTVNEFTWLSKNLKLRLKQISFVDLVFFSSEK
jgi:hypothetical protein